MVKRKFVEVGGKCNVESGSKANLGKSLLARVREFKEKWER